MPTSSGGGGCFGFLSSDCLGCSGSSGGIGRGGVVGPGFSSGGSTFTTFTGGSTVFGDGCGFSLVGVGRSSCSVFFTGGSPGRLRVGSSSRAIVVTTTITRDSPKQTTQPLIPTQGTRAGGGSGLGGGSGARSVSSLPQFGHFRARSFPFGYHVYRQLPQIFFGRSVIGASR